MTYNLELAFHAELDWARRDYKGDPLSPEEVMDMNLAWRNDLALVREWIQFQKNSGANPLGIVTPNGQ